MTMSQRDASRTRRLAAVLGGWGRSQGGRVAGRSMVYVIGSMLPQAVSVVLLPIFTRYLSRSDYGILSYSATVATFFSTIGAFAIQPFIVRQYWLAHARGEVREFLTTMFLFLVLHNVVLFGVASAVVPIAFAHFGVKVDFYPYVQLQFVSVVAQTLALVPMSYFRAQERAVMYVSMAFIASVLSSGLSLYLIVQHGMGVMGELYGQVAADLIMLLVFVGVMIRLGTLAWRPLYVREAYRYCLPLVPAQILAIFAGVGDRMILERWVPLSDLGLYSIAAGIAAITPILSSGVYSAIQPQIFRMATANELDAKILQIKQYLRWLLMFVMCGAIALSRDAVALMAGPAFRDSYKVAGLLIVATLVQSFITNVPSQYLTATGRTRFEMPCRLVGTLTGLATMVMLAQRFGIYGAAAGSIVLALATLASYAVVLHHVAPTQWCFAQDVAYLAAAALLGAAVGQLPIPNPLLSLVTKGALVTGIAGAYLMFASAGLRSAVAALSAQWSVQRS